MNMLKDVKIGELLLLDDQKHTAFLSCYMPWEGTLSLDLLDNLGRSYLHKRIPLKAGKQELSINLPKLPAGNYNAWINFGDKTVIRKLVVKRKRPVRQFLARLMSL